MKLTTNELYEASLEPQHGVLRRLLTKLWIAFGLVALTAIAWAEPWSGQLFARLLSAGVSHSVIDYALVPAVMVLRAVLMVEVIGYTYHRYFQHVGWFTRRAHVFRRNQKYHWIHHMIIYPIGRLYRRAVEYVAAEDGIGLSWVIPGLIVTGLFVLTHGLNLATIVFFIAFASYAKFIIDKSHSRFHEIDHPWAKSRYFQWLEEIHLLHHWDQRTNYTIVHPLMDMLFGTYRSPKKHQAELRAAMEDEELTVSDLINWRYLLIEATPAEYAAFVCAARQHPRSVRKVNMLAGVMKDRMTSHPEDARAADLHQKSLDLLAAIERSRRGATLW
jgi:sterol desaturase/sphingolipid hydroxylase (fatty acid hydroxylase superfamily)